MRRGWVERSARYGAVTLAAFPVLFACLITALIYTAIMPIVRPYTDLARLFVNSAPQEAVHTRRDLFTAAKAALDYEETAGSGTSDGGDTLPAASEAPAAEGIPASSFIRPNAGDIYGRLTIEGTSIDAPIYWNDSARELNAGIGTYPGGWLPGFGRTVMMAGHRNSWLKDLGSAQIGGIITVETHYETYTYEITDVAVYHMNDSDAYDFNREQENIIIYTCYPFDYVGMAKERYFVYGEPLSGLQVDRSS